MKKLTLFLIGGLSLLLTKNIKAQIPNGGFENWETIKFAIYEFEAPQRWMSGLLYDSYTGRPITVKPTTDSHSGNMAIVLENTPDTSENKIPAMISAYTGDYFEFEDGFVLNGKPVEFTGYFKHSSPADTNFFSISVNIYHDSILIGDANSFIGIKTNTYLPFNIPITYYDDLTPTKATVSIINASFDTIVTGTTITLDDLDFTYSTTGITQIKQFGNYNLFPNPANDFINISFQATQPENVEISIYQLSGSLVQTATLLADKGKNDFKINTSDLSTGAYIVKTTSASGLQSVSKLIIQ